MWNLNSHTLFSHSLQRWVGSVNMKTHSCPHYSSARMCTFLTHTSSSSAFPITPSRLPVLPSLHLALYPSLHPDLVSPCNSTSWTFSLSPTGSLYMSTPPTFHPHPPALCSHCSMSNGSTPPQQIHQVEAGRASAPTNASQRLALSRSTVCRSYRWQTCMAHKHTSAHAEGYRLAYRKIYVQWHKHLPAKQMHRHTGVLIGMRTHNANKCSCNHILTQTHKRIARNADVCKRLQMHKCLEMQFHM